MFKKLIKGMVIGSAALTIAASSAMAGQVEVNLYGASAQFEFWTAAAPKYLTDPANVGGYACGTGKAFHAKNSQQRIKGAEIHNRDAGIAVCNGNTAIPGTIIDGSGTKDTLIIRYTTNASYDGVLSIMDDNLYSPDKTACPTGGQRRQPVLDAATVLAASTGSAGNSIPNLACMDVHIGASDVAAASFAQASEGWDSGPAGGSIKTHSYYNVADPELPANGGYTSARPIVVPFAFFANNAPAAPVPFDNITRPMAVNLFKGGIANWNQFGVKEDGVTAIASMPVTLCFRHAGSGTHSTLDAVVMRGDANLPTVQQDGFSDDFYNEEVEAEIAPTIYFNKGSTEEIKCVGTIQGAIGYADADKCGSKCNGGDYGYAKTLAYNGVEPKAAFVKNGQYDFWAAQWLYYDADDTYNNDEIVSLINYAKVGTNMPGSKAEYWVAQDDLNFLKASDFALPFKK